MNLVYAFNPQTILVGDYIGEAWDLIEDTIWQVLRSRLTAHYLEDMRIIPSRHGADSVLLGSVALVLSSFFSNFADGAGTRRSSSVQMS